jgi:hypothetical protein
MDWVSVQKLVLELGCSACVDLTGGYSPENSRAIFIRGGEPWLMGYCWPTSFKVLEVLFLGEICSACLPSKKGVFAYPPEGVYFSNATL